MEWVNQFLLYGRGYGSGNWKTDGTCQIIKHAKVSSWGNIQNIN